MGFEPKYSVITASLGNVGDRFQTSGYKEDTGLEDKLHRAASIPGLSGVELCYGPGGDEGDAAAVKKLLAAYKLKAPVVNPPLSSGKRWRFGTLSAADEAVRRDAIALAKETIDFAEAVGAQMVNLWLGQDGFDYPFQVDYTAQWERMVKGVRECADYQPNIRLCLEFKPREPRNRALLDSASTTLLMVREIDRANVGITIDNGHVLQAGANMAQAAELCGRAGKLFNLHLNDNYAAWDDDMIVGSVHLIEYLELLFVLRKIGYSGWCSIDIFPFREDAFRATEESIRYLAAYNRWVEKVGDGKLAELIRAGDVTEVMRTVRATLFA
jgi:xylose isomerase